MRRPDPRVLLLLPALLALGCTVLSVRSDGAPARGARWLLLPVANQGEAAQAGERVEELLVTLLQTDKGVEVSHYGPSLPPRGGDPGGEPDDRARYERALAWGREQGFRYGIGGSVQEWRYRAASEGEAAVGLTLRVIDLQSARTVYTASGARAGWGRDTLTGTAQSLLRAMLGRLAVR